MHRTSIAVLLIVFASFASWSCQQTYNPVTGEYERTIYDRQQEIEVGANTYPRMIQLSQGRLEDPKLDAYLDELGNQLARVSHDPFFDYEFTVVNDSAPNAWALPGGKIAVTRGLLMEMKSEGQLAAVLGHEITHVTGRHSAKQQTRALPTQLLLLAGSIAVTQVSDGQMSDVGRIVVGAGTIGAQLYLASYSREHEREADQHGQVYMARAGYDPEGMVELHQLFQGLRQREPSAVEIWFSSHPAPGDRIRMAQQNAPTVRSQVDIPKGEQLNKFEERVVKTWHPREDAYDRMDEGMTAFKEGEYRQALQSFQEAKNKYDGEPLFDAWMGMAHANLQNQSSAQKHIQRALNDRPDLFHVRMMAGQIYMEGKAYQTSNKHLLAAKELVDVVPAIDFFVGRNHEQLGNRSEASKYYRSYLNKTQQGEKAQYAAQQLQRWHGSKNGSNGQPQ
jgi:predicted Zn-dependent protease